MNQRLPLHLVRGDRSVPAPHDGPMMVVSYLSLRRAVGILGIALPIILFVWGLLGARVWLDTISAYYTIRTRDALVGGLCTIGCFLFTYHGYETHDNVVTHVTGACAVLVAFLPSTHAGLQHTLHFVFAATLFVLLAYISAFRFTRHDGRPTEAKLTRNRVYRGCAVVMLICISLIPLGDVTHLATRLARIRPDFLLETLALWAFGFSWIVKGGVLWRDPRGLRIVSDRAAAPAREQAAALIRPVRYWCARMRYRDRSEVS